MKAWLLLALALALQGCGNSDERSDMAVSMRAVTALPGALFRPSPAPPDAATLRKTLEATGKPVISVTWPERGYAAFMLPYYPGKDGAQVWSSESYETVTLKDGILQATRGLGPDIMASQGPSLGQIAAGRGSLHRVYEYLDGNDTARTIDFDCQLAKAGAEKLQILDLGYQARVVVETCRRPDLTFENRYWFDSAGKLLQSQQMLVPGAVPLTIQQISW